MLIEHAQMHAEKCEGVRVRTLWGKEIREMKKGGVFKLLQGENIKIYN